MILRVLTPLFIGSVLAAAACSSSDGDANNSSSGGGKSDGGSSSGSNGSSSGGVQPTRVVCDTPIPAAPAGQLCAVTAGSSDKVLIQATVLAGKTIYENGAVLVDRSDPNGTITCAGCDCEAGGATVVACADGVLSPGLINSHDHMPFNVKGTPKPHGEERYEHRHDWRKGKHGHQVIKTDSSSDDPAGRQYAESRMLLSGVTSLVGSGSAPALVRNLDDTDNDGKLGYASAVDYRTFPLGDSDGTMATSGCSYGTIDKATRLGSRIYLPHIGEGMDVEARNEYLCLSGGAVNVIAANTSIVHGIGLDANDIAQVASVGAKLVWSPRTNISLYGQTADVLTYRRLGVNIALGTDWILSGSMNMTRELQCADSLNKISYNGEFSDYEIWSMATGNGAIAMGVQDKLGTIEQGFIADLALYNGSSHKDYRAVIDAQPQDVSLVMRGGAPLYGDAAVIEGLVASGDLDKCETMDACSSSKRYCAELDGGNTTATMAAAASDYKLFYCDTPADEPSCVPFRPNEYTGVPSANDKDGDGINDDVDNCSSVFNPNRIVNANAQPNFDNDTDGDSCDVCPLNEGTTCAAVNNDDTDGDGVLNASDNCPSQANPDQADGDTDGVGDLCDKCPNEANTAGAACTASISDIKQSIGWAVGDTVRIKGALVIAAGDDGLFLQTAAGGDYSAIFAFDRTVAGRPVQGDIIDLTGQVANFNDQIQVQTLTDFNVVSSGNPVPTPTLMAITDLAAASDVAKKKEGQLVRVDNVDVAAYDAAHFEATLTGTDASINGILFKFDAPTVGLHYDYVQGPLSFRFGANHINPREAADIVVDQNAARVVANLTPASLIVPPAGSATLNVSLNLPAKTGGTVVTLVATAGVTVPATVTIPAGSSKASLTVTATGATGATGTITASTPDQGANPVVANYTIQVPPTECLIISEYLEGSGNTKAIEIYNCGGALDLTQFLMCQINRGGTGTPSATAASLLLSAAGDANGATLAAGDVRVYCASGADALAGLCDVTASTVLQFNGNDSVYLVKDVDASGTCNAADTVIDAFGNLAGNVTGTPWAEHDYSRCNFTPNLGAGASFDPAASYLTAAPTVFTGLGVAPVAGCL